MKRKLTSNDLGSSNDTPPQNGATAGEEFEESWENITLDDKKKTVVYSKNCNDTDNVEEKDVVTVKPQHSPRDRRVPILPSRPDLELLSEATPPILTLPSRNELERNKPEQVSSLYDIFDLCVEVRQYCPKIVYSPLSSSLSISLSHTHTQHRNLALLIILIPQYK